MLVCAYHHAAPGFNPKYIINVFKANLVQICICTDKRTKINKKAEFGLYFKNKRSEKERPCDLKRKGYL